MKEVLIEEKGLNKQRGSVWIGRGGISSAGAIPFGGNFQEERGIRD